MVEITLKWLVFDPDRRGNKRYYVRKPGQKKVRIRGERGSAEFMAAYHEAISGKAPEKKGIKIVEGSFAWLCNQYYGSAVFRAELASVSQNTRRRILNNLCNTIGDLPFRRIETRHVNAWLDDRADRPEAANGLLKALRALFKFANARGISPHNPVATIHKIRNKTEGHHQWTIEEVRQFEAHHPIGTTPRLALAIMLFTGLRRGDAVQFGRQHVADGWFTIRHSKTKKLVNNPVLPALQQAIEASDTGDLAFLKTSFGKPFTAAGFGGAMRDWCDAAGLPHCTCHGLRKAGPAIAAQNGATDRQIMAIWGWDTEQMVSLYTRNADRRKLAEEGMKHLERGTDVEPEKVSPDLLVRREG